MMTVSNPVAGFGHRKTVKNNVPAPIAQTTRFQGIADQLEYEGALKDLDADTLQKLDKIQHHSKGLGHELAIEYGKDNSHIQWLNEERKSILNAELVNRNINPPISAKARELFHDLNRAVEATLDEQLPPPENLFKEAPVLGQKRTRKQSGVSASSRYRRAEE